MGISRINSLITTKTLAYSKKHSEYVIVRIDLGSEQYTLVDEVTFRKGTSVDDTTITFHYEGNHDFGLFEEKYLKPLIQQFVTDEAYKGFLGNVSQPVVVSYINTVTMAIAYKLLAVLVGNTRKDEGAKPVVSLPHSKDFQNTFVSADAGVWVERLSEAMDKNRNHRFSPGAFGNYMEVSITNDIPFSPIIHAAIVQAGLDAGWIINASPKQNMIEFKIYPYTKE